MKLYEFNIRFSLVVCLLVVVSYAILFQVVARTGMIERLMAMNFQWWEFLLVAGFIIARLLAYLLVPSILAALVIYVLARRLL